MNEIIFGLIGSFNDKIRTFLEIIYKMTAQSTVMPIGKTNNIFITDRTETVKSKLFYITKTVHFGNLSVY